MYIEISDSKVIKEALEIIGEVYDAKQVENVIMKLLKIYKCHNDYGNGGWYDIKKYVDKQAKNEISENGIDSL